MDINPAFPGLGEIIIIIIIIMFSRHNTLKLNQLHPQSAGLACTEGKEMGHRAKMGHKSIKCISMLSSILEQQLQNTGMP